MGGLKRGAGKMNGMDGWVARLFSWSVDDAEGDVGFGGVGPGWVVRRWTLGWKIGLGWDGAGIIWWCDKNAWC
jgi:hypothetical protein